MMKKIIRSILIRQIIQEQYLLMKRDEMYKAINEITAEFIQKKNY